MDVTLPEDGSLDGKVLYVLHPSGAETVYLVEDVKREGDGTRVYLVGMPRFVRGRGKVASGSTSRIESDLEHPKEGCVGCRIRIGDGVSTITDIRGRDTFILDSSEDFGQKEGKEFEVFSTAAGDRFKIVV